jgi:hypothetical protein
MAESHDRDDIRSNQGTSAKSKYSILIQTGGLAPAQGWRLTSLEPIPLSGSRS